jgi:LacI family transcriptional regulator/LacI family repressor for deo operon, udp, cdd, tsx, nupC, and nupG
MAGAPIDLALVSRGSRGFAAAADMALRLFRLPEPPTAIFAASDTQAMGVLSAAEAAGLPVPGELSVIGFDDIEMAAFVGLSTVRQPLRESGARGAARLCALPRGGSVRPMRETLPLEVVARRTTSTPRARSLSPQFTALPERAPP